MKHREVALSQKGQSLVELALILIFILLLLAGVVDLGRMMYEYLTMRDAAQEGAGYGSMFPNYCDEIVNRVKQNLPDDQYDVNVYVGSPPSPPNNLCENASPATACVNHEIWVTIHNDFSVTMPLLGEFVDPEGDGVPMDVVIKDSIVRPECK